MSNEQFAGETSSFRDKFTKRRVVVTFLLIFGAYAAIQSVVSFGKTEDTIAEPLDKVVKQEVKKEVKSPPPPPTEFKNTDEGAVDAGSYGLFGYQPTDDTPTTEPEDIDEEVALEELTLDDCIEADIVMAGINPEDIDDEVIQQCLILWEDFEDLVDDEEDDEPAYVPGGGGGGGGGGGDNPPEEDPLSTNSDLGIFNVDKINVLPFHGLRVVSFDEDGATMLVDDYFCKETEITPEPCFGPGKPLMGVLLAAADEKSSYTRVEIERNNPLLLEYSPARVWENDEIAKLAKEEILPGDIIRVTAIAEDGVSQSLFKLNIDALASDANLNIFDVDFIDVLPFDALQVKKFDDPGATLNMYDYLCDPSAIGPEPCVGGIGERAILSGLILQARDRNISHSKVEIERRNPFSLWDTPIKTWEDKEIDQLKDMQIWPEDIIRVTIVAENGRAENLFKLSVVNQTDNADLSQFDIGTSPVLEWPNIEVKSIEDLGAIANICPENINGELSPYFNCITTLAGVFIAPEDDNISDIQVSIYHNNKLSSVLLPVDKPDIFEGQDGLIELHKYILVENDIVFVEVLAEDGVATKNYKIRVVEGDYSDNVSLGQFMVQDYDVIAMGNSQIHNWDDPGATIELCNPASTTIHCLESLKGIFVTTDDDAAMYRSVHIDREGTYPPMAYVNEQIDELKDFVVLPDDIIRVVVVASNGRALGIYRVSIVDEKRDDMTLSSFDIDEHNVLLLPDVQVTNFSDEGASLFVDATYTTPCFSPDREGCMQIDLTGIFATSAVKDVDAIVYVYHDGYWTSWVGEEGIAQLATRELALNDMIAVVLTEQDGIQQTYYKVTIKEITQQQQISKIYPSKSGGSPAPVKKEPVNPDASNLQDQELKQEKDVEVEEVPTTDDQPEPDNKEVAKKEEKPAVDAVKVVEETEE
jgi:hypothetical protein